MKRESREQIEFSCGGFKHQDAKSPRAILVAGFTFRTLDICVEPDAATGTKFYADFVAGSSGPKEMTRPRVIHFASLATLFRQRAAAQVTKARFAFFYIGVAIRTDRIRVLPLKITKHRTKTGQNNQPD